MSILPKLNFLVFFTLLLFFGVSLFGFWAYPVREVFSNGAYLSSSVFAQEEAQAPLENEIPAPGKEIFKMQINDNGFEFEIETKETSVKKALESQAIEIHPQDIVFPSLEEEIFPGMRITILRAKPVILDLYGKQEEVFTQKENVQEFLEEKGIELKEDDLINVKLEEEIFPRMEIKIWKKPAPLQKTGEDQIGLASWYRFIPGDFAASRSFPRGTKLLVTNLFNDKKVIVSVNDRGPQAWTGRILDLERDAFAKIAPLQRGVVKVKIERLR